METEKKPDSPSKERKSDDVIPNVSKSELWVNSLPPDALTPDKAQILSGNAQVPRNQNYKDEDLLDGQSPVGKIFRK